MSGFEKFEAAIFDEGNIAPAELDLEEVAVMRGAEQHRLPAQRDAGLAVVEHAVGDIFGLSRLILDIGQEWALRRRPCRIKGFRDLLAGPGDHRVRGIEDRLGRAIIALERDDRGGWGEMVGKVENVPNGCRAERIDRLRIVADDCETGPVGPQRQQDLGLEPIGVLVLVNEDVVERAAYLHCDGGFGHRMAPVQQEVVVIEDVVPLLGHDIGLEQPTKLVRPIGTPGKTLGERLLERAPGIDRVGVDRQASVLAGEAGSRPGQAELRAYKVEEIRRIGAVENGEGRVEPDRKGVD